MLKRAALILIAASALLAQTDTFTVRMGAGVAFLPACDGMTEVFLHSDDPAVTGWTVIVTDSDGIRHTAYAEAWQGSGLAWFAVSDIAGSPEVRERR